MKRTHLVATSGIVFASILLIGLGACGNGDAFLSGNQVASSPSFCVDCTGVCCSLAIADCCPGTQCGAVGGGGGAGGAGGGGVGNSSDETGSSDDGDDGNGSDSNGSDDGTDSSDGDDGSGGGGGSCTMIPPIQCAMCSSDVCCSAVAGYDCCEGTAGCGVCDMGELGESGGGESGGDDTGGDDTAVGSGGGDSDAG